MPTRSPSRPGSLLRRLLADHRSSIPPVPVIPRSRIRQDFEHMARPDVTLLFRNLHIHL